MRKLYGVGINDADYVVEKSRNYGDVRSRCPYYTTWSRMIKRCYSAKYHEDQPSYIGCSVCDEWKTFSNFKKWMESKDWEGKQLDKDLKVYGNKIYSPETCVFVDQKINKLLNSKGKKKHQLPVGVHLQRYKDKLKYRAILNNKQIGVYGTPEEARNSYINAKIGYIMSVIGTLPKEIQGGVRDFVINEYLPEAVL